MDKIKWEEQKQRNRALEKRSRAVFRTRDEFNIGGNVIRMPSGAEYKVLPNGSWKRIK